MSKKMLWERRLLDLSLRNNLIDLRPTKNLLPILSTDLEALEDSLSGGSAFKLSAGFNIVGRKYPDDLGLADLHMLESYKELLESKKELYAPLNDLALIDAVKTLYRNSKLSIEENGANTLYLALGLLQWIEPKSPDKIRHAPLILLPMEMVRRSFLEGYTIRQRDDEVMINTTLLEMLKQDFGIKVEGLDPIPTDGESVKVEEVFSIIQDAVRTQKDWAVLRSAYLGIFSFSQFVLWNDLRNRADQLAENKLVKSLMDGKLAWDAESMDPDAPISDDGSLIPISTDASQLFAIRSAAQGKSFVLHGPPGTGKSQTITGIIANAIAQGKTVLFVAEKMAALSVVQKRMERLGLGDFCLELHSNKARKKDVLDQLMSASEKTSSHDPADYSKMADHTAALRQELDAYATALHRKRSSGFSFYEMLTMYEDHKDRQGIRIDDLYIENITKDRFAHDLKVIGELRALATSLGDVGKDPLRWIGAEHFDIASDHKNKIPPLARSYETASEALMQGARPLTDLIRKTGSYDHLILRRLLDAFELWKNLPDAWSDIADVKKTDLLLQQIETMAVHGERMQTIQKDLLVRWNKDLFAQDANSLQAQWQEIGNKGMILGFFAKNRLFKELSAYAKQRPDPHTLTDDLAKLIEYQTEQSAFEPIAKEYRSLLGSQDQGDETDWARITKLSEEARRSLILMDPYAIRDIQGTYRRLCAEGLDPAELYNKLRDLEEAHRALNAELPIKGSPDPDYLSAQVEFAKALQTKTDYIREWTQFNSKIRELADLGIDDFQNAAYRSHPSEFEVAYIQTVSRLLVIKTLHEDPVLANFSGATFDEKIKQFKASRSRLEELTKQEIFYRLASRVPNFTKEASKSSELGILQKAIRSNGRGLSIRRLFQQIPTILPRLAPCMLMSPISCAQYLEVQHAFDLVIFDEASQLPTAKAVGVLARGKEAIIVGDPKQMPPTAFFSGERPDEENIEQEDLESILEDCLALSMPQTHLLWHYRSRHESLISFSNHRFYESKLYTFPSVDDRARMVRFVPSKGVFDRGASRTNPIEAQMVVDEVIRRAKDPMRKDQSIGIVTFNIAQQSLIEDLLEKAYANDAELDTLLHQREEAIFVKNLENVQGDERDVILFSVGFGPDKEGRVYMNFGPLNQEGGWRRLNVAVTRSRLEMLVFSSLEPEDIDLSKTQAQGVQALKEFLSYAKTGSMSQIEIENRSFAKGIAASIRSYLESKGYRVAEQVGHSKFKIDLAVLDPRDEEKYLLGIMLDGETYRTAHTTEDRETSPLSVLQGLGWDLHRIWSVDHYQNPQKEMDKLTKHLEDLIAGWSGAKNSGSQMSGPAPAASSASKKEAAETVQENKPSDPADGAAEMIAPPSSEPIESVFTKIDEDKEGFSPIDPSLHMTQHKVEEIHRQKEQTFDKKEEMDRSGHATAFDTINAEEISKETKDPSAGISGTAKDALPHTKIFAPSKIVEQPYQSAMLKEKKMTAASFTHAKNQMPIMEYIAQVIEAEAPICEEQLYKKILKLFGMSRAGAEVQAHFIHLLHLVSPKKTYVEGIPYFWSKDQDPENYAIVRCTTKEDKRDIRHIHPKELQNAIELVLQDQIALPQDALIKEASKKLGYARSTNAIKEKLEQIILDLERDARIEKNGEMFRIRE